MCILSLLDATQCYLMMLFNADWWRLLVVATSHHRSLLLNPSGCGHVDKSAVTMPTCVSAIQNEHGWRLFRCLHLTNLWWVWFWICEGQLDFLVKNILNFNNNGYLAQKSQRISFWFVVKVITKKKLNVNFSVWYFSIITWCFIYWVLCITFTNA